MTFLLFCVLEIGNYEKCYFLFYIWRVLARVRSAIAKVHYR